jgi:uridine kinase
MQLKIDGHSVDAQCGESLLDLVKKLGLDSRFAYAAARGKHCRETFTLNYVPVREQETKSAQRPTPQRALRASNGEVTLLGTTARAATACTSAHMLFVFLLAMRKRYPKTRVRINYAVGAGLYTNVGDNMCLSPGEVEGIKQEMRAIVTADLPLERKRVDIDDAIDFFSADGQEDKVRLLQWRQFSYFDVYRQEDYVDYFYGEMAPSTGYASVFDLQALPTGLYLIRPSSENPNKPAKHVFLPHLTSVFSES